jgi:hypothetical protein
VFLKVLLFSVDSRGSRFQKKGEEALNPDKGDKQKMQPGLRREEKGGGIG